MANRGFGEEYKSGSSNAGIFGLVALGLAGVGVWKGIDYFDKIRANKEIDKATGNIAKSNANIIKSKARVEAMEQKAIATGKNGNGKIATVNYVTQAKEIIDGLLYSIPDKYGIKQYYVQSKPNGTKVKNALFETPIAALGQVQKVYNIYTQRTLVDDLQKLDLQNYALIKALFNAANKQKK